MKVKVILAALIMASGSAQASNGVNFLVGSNVGSDSMVVPNQELMVGAEVVVGKYLVGATYTSNTNSGYKDWSKDGMYLGSWSAKQDSQFANLYGGYFLTDYLALKAGVGVQKTEWSATTHEVVGPFPDGLLVNNYGDSATTLFGTVGVGFHYGVVNINIHYNHAFGDGVAGVSASDLHNVSILAGFKF